MSIFRCCQRSCYKRKLATGSRQARSADAWNYTTTTRCTCPAWRSRRSMLRSRKSSPRCVRRWGYMQNLRCTAEFEACGTELRYFQVYEAGQRAPTQWLKLVKYSLWSVKNHLRDSVWDYGLENKEVVISSWFTSDSRANLETIDERAHCGDRWLRAGAEARVAVVDKLVRAGAQCRHAPGFDGQDPFLFPFLERFVILGHAFGRNGTEVSCFEVREDARVYSSESLGLPHLQHCIFRL